MRVEPYRPCGRIFVFGSSQSRSAALRSADSSLRKEEIGGQGVRPFRENNPTVYWAPTAARALYIVGRGENWWIDLRRYDTTEFDRHRRLKYPLNGASEGSPERAFARERRRDQLGSITPSSPSASSLVPAEKVTFESPGPGSSAHSPSIFSDLPFASLSGPRQSPVLGSQTL